MELPFVFPFHQVSFTFHTPRRQRLSSLQRDRLGGLIINNDNVSKGSQHYSDGAKSKDEG